MISVCRKLPVFFGNDHQLEIITALLISRALAYQNIMKKLNLKFLSIAFILLLLFTAATFAQTGGGKGVRVKFKKGSNSATYAGTVSHSSDAYFLSVRRGQTLKIKISGSGEPAFHLGTVPKGSRNIEAYTPITEKDLTTYTYKIATDLDLAIPVGAIRGSSSYKLTITIK